MPFVALFRSAHISCRRNALDVALQYHRMLKPAMQDKTYTEYERGIANIAKN